MDDSMAAMLPPGFTAFAFAKPEPMVVSAARAGNFDEMRNAWAADPAAASEQDQFGQTAFHVVGVTGNLRLAEALASQYRGRRLDFDIRDNDGQTALFLAAAHNHGNVLQLLLRNNADANLPDVHGITPLMVACEKGSEDCAQRLLRHKTTCVDQKDQFGCTALIKACDAGHHAIAEMLINAGANANEMDDQGRTALHMACKNSDLGLVKKLHARGADLQARDLRGMGAIHFADAMDVKSFLASELRKFAMYRQQYILSLAKLPLSGRHGLLLSGVDLEKGCPIILKFYKRKSHRNKALDNILALDQDYVASVPADTVGELARYVFKDKEGYHMYPYCMVLYAGQQTLQNILSNPTGLRPAMPQQQLQHILRSVAECVEHIHLQGIIHGNLKPKNIMQFPDGHFRLINLETACKAGTVAEVHTTTLEICPPEVAKAWLREAPVEVTPARDVWALGCILYEMTFGRKLVADLIDEVQQQVKEGGAAPPKNPPTELLGVLEIVSLLTQQQILTLVSPSRILGLRTAHVQRAGGSASILVAVESSLKKKAIANTSSSAQPAPRNALQKKIDIKRSARRQAVAVNEANSAAAEQETWEESIIAISELLSKVLRVDERDRPGISEVLQSSVFRMASATEEDVVGNIKNMKRTALRNQTQMIGKIDELSSQVGTLVKAVSESSGSTRTASSQGAYVQPTTKCSEIPIATDGGKVSSTPPLARMSFTGEAIEVAPRSASKTKLGKVLSKMRSSQGSTKGSTKGSPTPSLSGSVKSVKL